MWHGSADYTQQERHSEELLALPNAVKILNEADAFELSEKKDLEGPEELHAEDKQFLGKSKKSWATRKPRNLLGSSRGFSQ